MKENYLTDEYCDPMLQAFSEDALGIYYCRQTHECNSCEFMNDCNNKIKKAIELVRTEVDLL